MSFKDHDKKTFIADTARDFAARRISKREFLRTMALGRHRLLGLRRRPSRQDRPSARQGPDRQLGAEPRRPTEMTKWLKDVGSQVQGHQDPLHLGSDAADGRAQPDQERVHRPDRHRSRNRDRAARAGARQGDAGRPGPARHLRPLLSRPVLDRDLRARHASTRRSTTRTSPISRCRTSTSTTSRSRWSRALAIYDGKWVGIPFDIPIFITMYRKDMLEKHGIKVADHLR